MELKIIHYPEAGGKLTNNDTVELCPFHPSGPSQIHTVLLSFNKIMSVAVAVRVTAGHAYE